MNWIKTVEEFTVPQLRSLICLHEYAYNHSEYLTTVMEIGYNTRSGYVYIAYEDGVSIAVFEGRTEAKDVVIFGYHYVTGDEIEYEDLETWFEDFLELNNLENERIDNSD